MTKETTERSAKCFPTRQILAWLGVLVLGVLARDPYRQRAANEGVHHITWLEVQSLDGALDRGNGKWMKRTYLCGTAVHTRKGFSELISCSVY